MEKRKRNTPKVFLLCFDNTKLIYQLFKTVKIHCLILITFLGIVMITCKNVL